MIKQHIDRFKGIFRQAFLKNMALLMSGTIVAQIITVATTPVLSRMYLPAAFGILGILNALAGTVAAASSLRYDMAVVLPKEDGEAANIVALASMIMLVVTLLTAGVMVVGGSPLAALLGHPEIRSWLYVVPALVFLTGLYQILTFWCTRKTEYRRLSISTMFASGTSAGGKLGLGFAGWGLPGLVGGQVFGQLIATLVLTFQVWRDDWRTLRGAFDLGVVREMARKYLDFPKFNVPVTLFNSVNKHFPILLLGVFFNATVAGLYALAFLVLKMPMTLIAGALRQVYFQRASQLYNEGQHLFPGQKRMTLILLGLGIVPTLAMIALAPWIFSFVLGEQWLEAGHYARYLTAYLFAMLLAVPSLSLVPILNLQRFMLYHQIVTVTVSAGGLAAGMVLENARLAIGLYSAAGAVMNLLLIFYLMYFTRRVDREGIKAYE